MSTSGKFNARKLMELAVEVMRQSVREPRADGKASPMVGAVLYKPDGTIETACRGELRYGDHAEFTLLERKNRKASSMARSCLPPWTDVCQGLVGIPNWDVPSGSSCADQGGLDRH